MDGEWMDGEAESWAAVRVVCACVPSLLCVCQPVRSSLVSTPRVLACHVLFFVLVGALPSLAKWRILFSRIYFSYRGFRFERK